MSQFVAHSMLARWQAGVRRLKLEINALALAYRHPQTPWYARLWLAVVVAYALSPIDLIPDFIPLLGYLDDLLLLPLGIYLALKLLPTPVLTECRRLAAQQTPSERPSNRLAAALIVSLWIAGLIVVSVLLYHRLA